MTRPTFFMLAAVAIDLLATSALAQTAGHPAAMPGMPAMSAPSDMAANTPEAAMMASMEKMSKDMAAVPMTGDADREFVEMMIPHHRGAVEMARFELAKGKDPAMRKLARQIIAAQQAEIGQMQAWLRHHPAR